MYKKGTVFNIQRFSTHDGPGIRTVVFLKGCPLDCIWCHNPESKSMTREVFYKPGQCVGCEKCKAVCPQGCHAFEKGSHLYHRENCLRCGQCAETCYADALELCGEEKDTAQILEIVMRDKSFYSQGGGGLTLSGGEPLMQYDFSLELLTLAKEKGLHTAVETCGFTARDLTAISKVTDLWLYDVKLLCDELHRKYTGVSNKKILENLNFLDSMGANIILRCPVIPGVNLNDNYFSALADLANRLPSVREIHLQPYHPLGLSKAERLGKTQGYEETAFLERSVVEPYAKRLQEKVTAAVGIQ